MSDGPRRGALLVLFLTVFIDLIGFGIVLPLLPLYAKQFAVDEGGWVIALLMSSFSFMQFLFAPLWGRLSDRIGRRPVLLIGLAGSVVFYGLFGVASVIQSLALLFVARIGAGVAGATVSTAQSYIADTTSLGGRHKGMALIGAAFGLGFTFGPMLAILALPAEGGEVHTGPGPGYAASALSAVALLLAWFMLPESLDPQRDHPERRLINMAALRDAVATPSIGLLLLISFVSVFSFANFESTLSLLLQGEQRVGGVVTPFRFNLHDVCWMFSYIGFILVLVQGGLVRRLSGRVPEVPLAVVGGVIEIIGFALLMYVIHTPNVTLLFVTLAVLVCGFAFITPSVNSLISRRSDPAKQGGILGLLQSVNSMARIVGPMVGIPLLYQGLTWPFWLAVTLMGLAIGLMLLAGKSGRDYPGKSATAEAEVEPANVA